MNARNKYVLFNKLLLTISKLKETAYHHYGNSPFSILRFIYYSVFRVNVFLVYENDLDSDISDPNLDPEYTVLSPSLEKLSELRGRLDLTREFYCDQVYNYKTCYIAFKNDDPAYLLWVAYNDDYNRFLIFPDDVVGFHYMVTLPKYRGNHLSSTMLSYVSLEYKKKGYRKAVSVVHSSNLPAVKAMEKAGYKHVAQIKSLGQFNKKFKVT